MHTERNAVGQQRWERGGKWTSQNRTVKGGGHRDEHRGAREREDSPTCAHHCVPDSPPSTDVRWSRVVTTTVLSAFVKLGTWQDTHGE